MPSKQYELCRTVLHRLEDAGVLRGLVLIGSWCLVLYREYFQDVGELSAVRTRDMDFLVPSAAGFDRTVSVPELLKDLGFIVGFRGEQGAMILEHPELLIEFLVPERGRGSDAMRDLPKLGVNAQPLRFMDAALMQTVRLSFGGVIVTVPHPAGFALHKLLVVPRRRKAEKREKDLAAAFAVLELLEKKGEMRLVRELAARFPAPWRKSIARTLLANRGEPWAEAMGLT